MQTQIFLFICAISFTNGLPCSNYVKYQTRECKIYATMSLPDYFDGDYELVVNASYVSINETDGPVDLLQRVPNMENHVIRDLKYNLSFSGCYSKMKVQSVVMNGKLICLGNRLHVTEKEIDFLTRFSIHDLTNVRMNHQTRTFRDKRQLYRANLLKQDGASNWIRWYNFLHSYPINEFRQSSPNSSGGIGFSEITSTPELNETEFGVNSNENVSISIEDYEDDENVSD